MRLVKLYSDLPSFHTIEFKTGVNFIIGKRYNPELVNEKNSYNGVGKSLIIELVHFCLASNSISCFKEIGNYSCFLDFSIDGIIHTVKRNFYGEQLIFLDGSSKNLSEVKGFLGCKCFSPNLPKYVSFRSLISRFIRRYKKNYSKYDEPLSNEQKPISLVNNGYLLGLSSDYIIKKIENKETYSLLNSTKKSLKSDEILVDYFNGKGNIDFKIRDYEDKLSVLSNKISEFKILDNYKSVKDETDELSLRCNTLANRISVLQNMISKSTRFKPSKENCDDVFNLYNEMNLKLPNAIVKGVQEVVLFHNTLQELREKSYFEQQQKCLLEKKQLEQYLQEMEKKLSEKMTLLDSSGALDEYNKMCQTQMDLQAELNKLREYKKLMSKYESEIALSKLNKANITIENKSYLDSINKLQNEIMNKFRSFSRRFYNDKPSGLTIELNSKDNKIAFDINADIEGDSSDGINEVKIFCYDMTNLKLRNHNINFIFHDSRLLANMDPRQIIIWFDIIKEYFPDDGEDQYIVSINEDYIIASCEMTTSDKGDELKEFINSHTRITLTDESPKSKLLGIQINIKYDK